jgi:CDP-glycerol glycerophosphotransferase (TagB/SpsB family)
MGSESFQAVSTLSQPVLAPYLVDDGDATIEAAQARIDRECHLLAGSGWFDAQWYVLNHPDVARAGVDPLRHFCEYGWRQLYNPSAEFDVWWYWASYLDPAREVVNPLVHYALIGHSAGLAFRPGPYRTDFPGYVLTPATTVRRACLFAGYDRDGLVDETVVAYLRELSRHADVWYLADGDMRAGQLEKLSGITRGAWCVRHGAYDFGSWSMLARDLVGWDALQAYEEVLLVNDSCYLLRSLDDVFARMNGKACDWWGMQATKGLFATRHLADNQFREPVPMDEVRREWLPRYAQAYPYDFHVGSYFLALRKPVIADAGFRKRLDAVVPQARKSNIIGKYEIGIGRYLLAAGHPFETFIEHLHPFHPIYTETAFTLIAQGFPLFKRYLLAENHYRVVGLADWKERILREVPEAPVELMERQLLRVSDHEKLYRNLRLVPGPAGHPARPRMLAGEAFVRADAATPTYDHWWAFPVCAFTHRFTGNERALFEAVKDDPSIKKIVLTRGRHVEVDGENVVVMPLRSPEGQQHLLRAGQIFIKHSPTRNIVFPVSPELHNIINLWHGVPLKRIGYASLDMADKLDPLAEEHRKCRAVISASRVDTMAMASAFYPLSYNDVWPTGLPRHDFITRRLDALPAHLREQYDRLGQLLRGRRLVLFVPTFRQAQDEAYYRFSVDELAWLKDWLDKHNAVLGVREHMADKSRVYGTALATIGAVNLSDAHFEDVEVLYRHAAMLVTDYSSCFIDFMLTGRPMVSFAYDFDRYVNGERGLFYDMDHVFPGPVCRDFGQLQAALENGFEPPTAIDRERYAWKRRLFLDYLDDANAWRVAQRVKQLYRGLQGVSSGRNVSREA